MVLKIGNKLALVLIGLSLVVIALVSSLFYYQFELALEERVLLQLSSVKKLKVSQIQDELYAIRSQFEGLSDANTPNFSSFFKVDTLSISGNVNGYPVEFPDHLDTGQIIIRDLTLEDSMGVITLAFIKPIRKQFLVGLVKPDIQSILLERTGLGETGESYLVGMDFKMRSASRFMPERIPTSILVNTFGVQQAIAGKSGIGMFEDYRGVEVFSSYEKIDFNGLTWIILSEMDRQEAFIPLGKVKNNFLVILVIILIFILLASYWLARKIVKPLLLMESKLTEMSKGNIDQFIPEKKRDDEIGKMFVALGRLVSALQQTISFAREIGSGNFDKEYVLLGSHDKLGQALIQMQSELKKLKENEAYLVLEGQRALLNGEEAERSRLSRELHDGLGPLLTTLRINVQVATLDEDKKSELLRSIDETIREVRWMSNNLMPSVLVDFGAGEAIGNIVKQFNQGPINIRYSYEPMEGLVLPKSTNITLYRVAQEALNNAIKHSGATDIKISLTEFEDRVSFYIYDNGSGFNVSQNYQGHGLINIKERIKLEHGLLEIQSDKDGTSIEVEIPIK